MKKFLLGSTALLGAALFVGEAVADPVTPAMTTPKLTISGQSTFNAWWFNNDNKILNNGDFGQGYGLGNTVADLDLPVGNSTYNKESLSGGDQRAFGRGYLFTMDDSSLRFDVTGKTDPGMDYGFVVIVNTDTQQTSYDKTIKENYIWAGGTWGKLTAGDTNGVEDIMAFGGFDPLGGTGGFDGNFDRVVNFVTGAVTSVDLVGSTGKSTKVTYQTPRYYGFQAGITFTPQSGHLGHGKANTTHDYYGSKGELNAFDKRSIAGGLNFLNKWNNGFEWGLSGTAIFAKTQPEWTGAIWEIVDSNNTLVAGGPGINGNRKNTASFAIGTVMRYSGFEFGFEFGDNGRSQQIKNLAANTAINGQPGVKTNAGWFIDTGLAYNWGPTKFSVGYMYTRRDAAGLRGTVAQNNAQFFKTKARTNVITASVDHKLAPGAGVYFEYAHYDMKNQGFNVDAMLHNSLNTNFVNGTKASGGSWTGPVGPKQKSDAFVVGTKVKF